MEDAPTHGNAQYVRNAVWERGTNRSSCMCCTAHWSSTRIARYRNTAQHWCILGLNQPSVLIIVGDLVSSFILNRMQAQRLLHVVSKMHERNWSFILSQHSYCSFPHGSIFSQLLFVIYNNEHSWTYFNSLVLLTTPTIYSVLIKTSPFYYLVPVNGESEKGSKSLNLD